MTRKFIYTAPFRRCWKAMGLHDEDLHILEEMLLRNPLAGDVIEGTGGARKVRIQLEGRGKRGGGRVIYLDVFEKENLYLLFAYPKNVGSVAMLLNNLIFFQKIRINESADDSHMDFFIF